MAEYIKKSAAICVAEKYGCDNGSSLGIHSGLADCIASEIDALPAADVVQVVRCKDCRRAEKDHLFGGYWCHGYRVSPDGFCSYGERKEGADNG